MCFVFKDNSATTVLLTKLLKLSFNIFIEFHTDVCLLEYVANSTNNCYCVIQNVLTVLTRSQLLEGISLMNEQTYMHWHVFHVTHLIV